MYIERQQAEMTSGIFNVPLPPNLTGLNLMCLTGGDFQQMARRVSIIYKLYKKTISILALLWIFGTILIDLIERATIYDGIFSIAVVGLMVQCLLRLVVRG